MATATAKKKPSAPRTEQLVEFTDSRGLTLPVDREQGVIRGVKVLGQQSKNGRSYLPEALRKAASLYEGAKVNVNHPAGAPDTPRQYQDRLGSLRNIAIREDGLYGDLHYNPKHPLAEQLAWDAENSPENVGLSHNATGRTKRQGRGIVVEEITGVKSVDIVADPATTAGLFEHTDPTAGGQPMSLETVTLESLKAERPDLLECLRSELAEGEQAKQQAAELKALKEELDQLKAEKALAEEREKVNQLIAEAKLPEATVTDIFCEQVLVADPDRRAALIEDRKVLARAAVAKPKSVESGRETFTESQAAPKSGKEFAALIRG